ncbi:MAG TPA: hypothetical protein VKZ60_08160 [Chloroflexota bacterium]|nr:hypothetical protein [Chloroflexota bacterium]
MRELAAASDEEAAWARIAPLLERLSLEELVELDQRLHLTPADLRPDPPYTLRRRVLVRVLQRKLAAFLYDCFDPFINPWVLEARMRQLFWRLEFVRSLADQLEEVAEAYKDEPDLPWTVSSNLFGMANAALLAWHMGGWDESAPGYGQGPVPLNLDFRPTGPVLAVRPP